MPASSLPPETVLTVILGASWFPRAPKLAAGRSFYNSAADLFEYLTDPNGVGVPLQNVEWLFDDSRSPTDQLEDIGDFLSRRGRELSLQGSPVDNLILYYVGHGLFTARERSYCLAVRATNENNEGL